MKVKVETALFQVPFGSHLYGTNGPTSDFDYKVVCLPSHETLLLNTRVTNRKVKPEGIGPDGKMQPGEAEYEYIPLQIFLDDFFNGQTYAIEIAFAVLQDKMMIDGKNVTEVLSEKDLSIYKSIEYTYEWMSDLVRYFRTRNISKMVGYAVSQSRNYGLKTERYTSLCNVVSTILEFNREFSMTFKNGQVNNALGDLKLSAKPELVSALLMIDHVKECEIENAQGGSALAPAIDICGKKFPLTATWNTLLKSVNGSIAQYGERVKKYDGEGVDWKALSHAIRITEQVIELSLSGSIVFPRPNATYLRDVKEGKVSLDDATAYLTARFNEVDVAVEKSVLQERTPELEESFTKFKLDVLKKYYDL